MKPSRLRRQKRRDKRLAEELIECYRHGAAWSRGKQGHKQRSRRNEFAWAQDKEGMKTMHRGGSKYFNDNLPPLVRFLNSQVGKSWDGVYARLSRQLDKGTASGLHVFQHLEEMLAVKVEIVHTDHQTSIVGQMPYGGRRALYSTEKRPAFYVHPRSGVLMKAPRRKDYQERGIGNDI
jgi:hypothetical protein